MRRDSRIGGAAAVEVGADGHQHERAPGGIASLRDELVDERRPLGLVAAAGEELLELVDRHDQPASSRGLGGRALERPGGVLARSQQRELPVLAAGQHAGRERGEQPGPQRRRLAAARRADDPDQRRARQARHHLGHQPLAAEEQLGVRDIIRS